MACAKLTKRNPADVRENQILSVERFKASEV